MFKILMFTVHGHAFKSIVVHYFWPSNTLVTKLHRTPAGDRCVG